MSQQQSSRRNPLSVKLRFKNETEADFIEHHARNISRNGVFVRTREPIEEGTPLKFDMQLRSGKTVLHGVGRVVWRRTAGSSQHPPGMGIKFIKMDPDSRALVDRIVAARGGTPARYEGGLLGSDSSPPTPSARGIDRSSASPSSSKQPFFPDTTRPEEFPRDEDTTEVRHMTEFLAQALTEGGADAQTTAEAQARAREARLRDEAMHQREQQARSSRPAPASHPPAISIAPDPEPSRPAFEDEKETAPYPSPPQAEPAASEAEAPPAPRPEEDAVSSLRPAPEASAHQPPDETCPPHAVARDTPPPTSGEEAAPSTSPTSEVMRAPSLSEPREAEPSRRGWGPMVWLPLALTVIGLLVGGYLYVTRPRPKSAPLAPAAEEAPAAADSTQKAVGEPAEPAAARVPPTSPASAVGSEAQDAGAEAEEAASAEAPTSPMPQKKRVALEVRTEPGNASLYVDEKLHARSPATLRLPAGRAVTLKTRLRGYEDIERTLEPDEVEEPLVLELRPLPYVLEVRTQPPGATIHVLSKTATSPARIEVGRLVGPVGVKATKPGFQPARKMLPRSAFESRNDHMHARVRLRLRRKQAEPGNTPSSPELEAPQPESPSTEAPAPEPPKGSDSPSPKAPDERLPERDLPLNPF